MTEQLHPDCGCKIVRSDKKKKDQNCSCEPCIISTSIKGDCGCHTAARETEKKK